MKKVTKPQKRATRLYAPLTLSPAAVVMLVTALPASDRPMSATVGPMTTGGMSLDTHFVPAKWMTIAMMTYTMPANAAPTRMPR